VLPCEVLGKSMGNLRDYDFHLPSLLAAPKNKELLKWIKDSKCKCSFECAIAANVAWHPSLYPRILLSTIRNIIK